MSTLWVLCLSDECGSILHALQLPNLQIIRLQDFEEYDSALGLARENRSRIEYYFTCTPLLPLYVLDHDPAIDLITYLDSDLYFYGDPEEIFSEIGDHSIAIIEHRFPPVLREKLLPMGKYNVGWISFKRDQFGLNALHWWRERCLEWCYDRVESDRFADQKYLDRFPQLFRNVIELRHKGANTAPYNLANYDVHASQGQVMIDDEVLIFFHFHGFNQIGPRLFDPHLYTYGVPLTPSIRNLIVKPYALCYLEALSELDSYLKEFRLSFKTRKSSRHISSQRPVKFIINEIILCYEYILHHLRGDFLKIEDKRRFLHDH